MWRIATLGLLITCATAGTAEGKAALEVKDYAVARKELEPPAEAGDAEAQFLLGEIYRRGLGVSASPRMAQKWYAPAAAQGHGGAAGELGILYWKARKKEQALEFLRAGAKANHVRAMYTLAILDYRGAEVGLNEKERNDLFLRAAKGGHPDAQAKHAHNLRFGKLDGEKDLDEAEKWYRKAAAQGHPHAHAGVAACRFSHYDQGDGSYNMTAKDQAFDWYNKAALLGDYQSQHWLTFYYGVQLRNAQSHAWGTIASTTKNAWPATSPVIKKVYKKWSKGIKDYLKKTKKYKKPEDVREGKQLAKQYLKQIRANLKKPLPWEDSGR